MKWTSVALFVVLVAWSPGWAWDGYDYGKGGYVEIGRGNLVRSGETIEIYDWTSGTYKDVEVQSVDERGGSVEVEIYDPEAGEYRTLDMED